MPGQAVRAETAPWEARIAEAQSAHDLAASERGLLVTKQTDAKQRLEVRSKHIEETLSKSCDDACILAGRLIFAGGCCCTFTCCLVPLWVELPVCNRDSTSVNAALICRMQSLGWRMPRKRRKPRRRR